MDNETKKRKKTEDLLINLEEMVDRFKARLKQGNAIHSTQIIQSVDRLLVPYSREVEFHELKGDWSPLRNVKWYRPEEDALSATYCDEIFAITFEVATRPHLGALRVQIRHKYSCFQVVAIQVTAEKEPAHNISWRRLSPVALVGEFKKNLVPVIFAVISENCALKESLNLHRLKNAIAACSFD